MVADGGPDEVNMSGEGVLRRGTFGWVFERNICLSVPVRVVSVAVALNYGNTRIVSPAEPSGEPLGRRVPLAYVSSERISIALRGNFATRRGSDCLLYL